MTELPVSSNKLEPENAVLVAHPSQSQVVMLGVAATLPIGTAPGTVAAGDDARFSDAREWTAETISAPEAAAGTSTIRRAVTAARMRQAVEGWWAAIPASSKLSGIAEGATANAPDKDLRDRSTHTGTQSASTIDGLADVATSGRYADLVGRPSFGSAAEAEIGDFATAAQGTLALSALQPGAQLPWADITGKPTFAAVATSGEYTDLANRPALGTAALRDVGTTTGTVAAGNDDRLTDPREWTASTVGQAEAEAGIATSRRAWTALRVRQAVIGWWNVSSAKNKLDGIEEGAQANPGVATTNAPGLLPRLPGGTTLYLRADGTFASPGVSGAGSVSVSGSPVSGQYARWTDPDTITGVSGIPWADISDKPTLGTAAARDVGSTANTVAAGNDNRLTNAREWTATTVSQSEAEAGNATTRRAWTAVRVRQAVAAWWNGSTDKSKLDGIASGATANASDAQLRNRATHTGSQAISTVSGLQAALDGKAALETSVRVFDAGGNNSANRPLGAAIVYWINVTAEPTNASAGDLWFEVD